MYFPEGLWVVSQEW